MINVKCTRCGVVNAVSNEVCKVCGVELLQPLPPFEPQRQTFQYDRSTHSSASNLIGPFDGVGDVVSPTLSLFAKNFWLITKIVFLIFAPFEIMKILSLREVERDWQRAVGIFMLGLACNVLIAPALIYALTKVIQTGEAPGVAESYRFGVTKLGKLGVCAAVAWVLQTLGLILLIIPGIIISLALEVVYPVAVLENGSLRRILERSCDLTRGHRTRIFLASIIVTVIVAIIDLPISLLFPQNSAVWPVAVMSAIITDTITQVTTVLSLVIYLSILRTLETQRSQ